MELIHTDTAISDMWHIMWIWTNVLQ